MRLLDFITSLLARFSKDTVLEDLRITKGELETGVMPAYEAAEKLFGTTKLKSPEVVQVTADFYRNYKAPTSKKNPHLIAEILLYIRNVVSNLKYIETQIETLLEQDVLKDGLTAKKALLVRAAEYLSFYTRYSTDLLNYILVMESQAASTDAGHGLSPAQINFIQKNIANFARIATILNLPDDKFQKQLEETPDVVLNAQTAGVLVGAYSEAKLDPQALVMLQGFQGSPIYHVRLLVAEWQADRYKAFKDKKRMLELRLLNLKMINEKTPDPKIQQEIEYIQNRVESIEFKMAKMES